ncbi:T9SS type A sorting domain-containing protein [candidate division KSB1 bacterium]|nr:T9SS type A sorting domain-containing protein [candidate division KSB1 bacterium]
MIKIWHLLLICTPVFAGTFTVTHTAMEGEGSLNWAMQQAANNPGADTVNFALPTIDPNYDAKRGTWEFIYTSALPEISDDGTFIDGFSQERNMGDTNPDGLEIVITGQVSPVELPAVVFTSAYNKISGLCIGRFRAHHIWIAGENAHHNTIEGCYIGLEPTGEASFKVKKSNGINIREGAHHNLIGGVGDRKKNLIGGFYYEAIEIIHSNTHSNRIVGNCIGVNKYGVKAVGNGWGEFGLYNPDAPKDSLFAAIYLLHGTHGNVIGGSNPGEGNIIGASGRSAIELRIENTSNNYILGNYLGIGGDGETAVPNREAGIFLWAGPSYNYIGGLAPSERNYISGNDQNGIQIFGDCQHNFIRGNYIGTNASASITVPNGANGVYLTADSRNKKPTYNTIGPANVILADVPDTELTPIAAVKLEYTGTSFNTVSENFIGSNPGGTLTSQNSGIIVLKGANFNTLGPNNRISGCAKYPILIKDNGTIGNTVTRNSIYNNGQPPITLLAGGNTELGSPFILNASSTNIFGFTVPYSVVEIYSDTGEEAQTFVGSANANQFGNYNWNGTINQAYVSATTTDAAGNTSQLSISRIVPVELVSFTAIRDRNDVKLEWITESETHNLGFDVERQTNSDFIKVGFVPGAGTSASPRQYRFIDTLPGSSDLSYRLRQIDFDGSISYSPVVSVTSAIPAGFDVSPAFPNPFNGATTIDITLPEENVAVVRVFDLRGSCVKSLLNARCRAGRYRILWNGDDENHRPVPSGLYFLHVNAGSTSCVRKVVLAR